jgi:hypothetical protein
MNATFQKAEKKCNKKKFAQPGACQHQEKGKEGEKENK